MAQVRVSGGLVRLQEAKTVGFSGRPCVTAGTSGAAVASPVLTRISCKSPQNSVACSRSKLSQYLKVGINVKNKIFTLKPDCVTQNTQMLLQINHRLSVV